MQKFDCELRRISMIVEIRINNCYIFNQEVIFSMNADMRNKRFITNVHKENNFNILKAAGIYGSNNTGKTRFVKCIADIKNALLNRKSRLMSNLFTDNSICELGVTFLEFNREFSFDFKFDENKEEYIYECFSEIIKDQYGNEKTQCWFKKDVKNKEYYCADENLDIMLPVISNNSLFFYQIDTTKFKYLDEMKKILISFANKIDIVNMNNIPIKHTIELMKNKNNLQKKIVEFIKNADLYMDNFEFVDMDKIKFSKKDEGKADENALNLPDSIMDQIRLVSTYKGIQVPSMIFDSTGTKKIAALASYVIEALEKGRILIIDELDSSLHFKLTRAIVAMFNNELNTKAQMIFTAHDISLMDCKKLFRKEQIWFVHKDKYNVYFYSLANFTAQQGVRETTDIIEKYKKGALGAIPEPDLINTLISIHNDTVKGGTSSDDE